MDSKSQASRGCAKPRHFLPSDVTMAVRVGRRCAATPQLPDAGARTRMSPFHIRTPLLHSRPMSRPGHDVYLKLEALQPSGSFKLRGVGAACERAVAGGARHLISSSGGNAGLAVAYAGTRLGVRVTIFVPGTTP